MSVFVPDFIFSHITSISNQFLIEQGINALLLDVDNTLTSHDASEVSSEVFQWVLEMQKAGIKLCIVSNNTKERVQPFAKYLGLACEYWSLKPFHKGIKSALRALDVKKETTAIVGDQIFTDVLGGNLFGLKTIMVEYLSEREISSIRLKRGLEKPFVQLYYKNGGVRY